MPPHGNYQTLRVRVPHPLNVAWRPCYLASECPVQFPTGAVRHAIHAACLDTVLRGTAAPTAASQPSRALHACVSQTMSSRGSATQELCTSLKTAAANKPIIRYVTLHYMLHSSRSVNPIRCQREARWGTDNRRILQDH